MDGARDPVQATTEEAQSTTSAGNGNSSQNCPDQVSVSSDGKSSEVATNTHTPKSNSTQKAVSEGNENTKKQKPRLRKGKWTIEEEEYTSRIIQYFSTGLLSLPDGATLRSYLADKLNCDPMRITKKFTGACCLGRRAYHLRDRPRASPAEVEMANFELLHLEQRFRLRVEHEQTGLPLPPRHELLASHPIPTAAVMPSLFSLQQQNPAIKATNPWIQNPVIAPSPGHPSLIPGLTGIIPNSTVPGVNGSLNLQNSSSLLLAAGQLLLQNNKERTPASNSSPAAAAPLQMLNNLVASYALSQVMSQQQAGIPVLQATGTGASPVISTAPTVNNSSSAAPTSNLNLNVPEPITSKTPQASVVHSPDQLPKSVQSHRMESKDNVSDQTSLDLKKEAHTKKLKAAFEEQQRALRLAYEKSLQDAEEWDKKPTVTEGQKAALNSNDTKVTTDASNKPSTSSSSNAVSPAEQLQRSYEAHLASLQRAEQQTSVKTQPKSSLPASSQVRSTSETKVVGNASESADTKAGTSEQKKTRDEEAGAILLGFLNSLRGSYEEARGSYEEAVQAKSGEEGIGKKKNDNSRTKKLIATDADTESAPTVQLESSTVMTEVSSDSSTQNIERNNGNENDHSQLSTKSRRQASDPITSLSHFQSSKRKVKPASVTETSSSTSSQRTTEQPSSSQEDSKSDKIDNSSSEESEREISGSERISKGPPRKRLKGFHEPHEFTRENLMAHSKRMDMECGQSGDVSSSDE